MKKLTSIVVLTLIMTLVVTPLTVNAEEVSNEKTPFERLEEKKENSDSKKEERLAKAVENYELRKEARLEVQSRRLEIIAEYAPDMLDEYETGFATHNEIHEELFNANKAVRETMFTEAQEEIEALAEELLAQAEAGEITYNEVREQLKVLKEEKRAESEAFKLELKEALEEIRAEEEINREERKALGESLKDAIEAEDYETAEEIIIELYDYLLSHIEFDQYKLDVISSYLDIV